MKVLADDIMSYIDFLIQNQNLYISLHGKIANFSIFSRYNIHTHPYCVYIKNSCNLPSKCISQQKKVLGKCESGDFFGVCHAGMGEFIYPLKTTDECFGFISVSGYHVDNEKCINRKKELIEDSRFSFYSLPQKEDIDTLLRPLVLMCELYYKENRRELTSNSIISDIMLYINENHTLNTTVKSLSDKFNYSVSAISHQFKTRFGMSISQYIEKLRIEDAKALLIQTSLQITEIAVLLGFCNSGHFSAVFKKNIGIGPNQYRKNYQSKRHR